MNPGIKYSIQLGGHIWMWGINGPNIIICTGLIYVLLSYPDWIQRYEVHQGMDIPVVLNWDKVQSFGHNSFMSAICFMFIEVYGCSKEMKFLFCSCPSFLLLLHPFLIFSIKKYSGNEVGQWKSLYEKLKIPPAKYSSSFFQTPLTFKGSHICSETIRQWFSVSYEFWSVKDCF